jgi:pimeloyl-ACP methyl ester carboxylesterase
MGVLGEKFTVYAIDSRGHGKSSRVKTLHYADMAEDIAAFIEALGLEKPMFYGFSDGGVIGLLLAINHPGLLSRLASSGANMNPESLSKGFLLFVRAMYRLTRGCKWRCQRSWASRPHGLARLGAFQAFFCVLENRTWNMVTARVLAK